MIEEREVRGEAGGMRVLRDERFAPYRGVGDGRIRRHKRRCMHREARRKPAALRAIGRSGPGSSVARALAAAGAVAGAVAALRFTRARGDSDRERIARPEGHQEPHGNCAAEEAHQRFNDLA